MDWWKKTRPAVERARKTFSSSATVPALEVAPRPSFFLGAHLLAGRLDRSVSMLSPSSHLDGPQKPTETVGTNVAIPPRLDTHAHTRARPIVFFFQTKQETKLEYNVETIPCQQRRHRRRSMWWVHFDFFFWFTIVVVSKSRYDWIV